MEHNHYPQELAPCPLCEGFKKQNYLFCANCRKVFIEEAATSALKGETPSTIEEWGEKKIRERLSQLAKTVEMARNHRNTCQSQKTKKINEIFREKTKDHPLHPNVADRAREKIEEEQGKKIWMDIGGNIAVKNLRIAERRDKEAKRLLEDLMAKKSLLAEATEILKETKVK